MESSRSHAPRVATAVQQTRGRIRARLPWWATRPSLPSDSLSISNREDIFNLITFLIHSRSPVNHIACTSQTLAPSWHDRPHSYIRNTSSRESGTTPLSTSIFTAAILASPVIGCLLQAISYVLETQLEFCCGGDSIQAVTSVLYMLK
jgi:hypothetical protein